VMKIFLLFYMCDFAVGLTHCYKTTVFFTFITRIALSRVHYLRQRSLSDSSVNMFLLCLTLIFDLELIQLTQLFPVVGAISAPNFVKIRRSQ